MAAARSEAELREELSHYCRVAYHHRLATGTGGNLSARIPGTDRVLITPSAVSLRECAPEDFITVDLDGREGRGPRPLHSVEGGLPPHGGVPGASRRRRDLAPAPAVLHRLRGPKPADPAGDDHRRGAAGRDAGRPGGAVGLAEAREPRARRGRWRPPRRSSSSSSATACSRSARRSARPSTSPTSARTPRAWRTSSRSRPAPATAASGTSRCRSSPACTSTRGIPRSRVTRVRSIAGGDAANLTRARPRVPHRHAHGRAGALHRRRADPRPDRARPHGRRGARARPSRPRRDRPRRARRHDVARGEILLFKTDNSRLWTQRRLPEGLHVRRRVTPRSCSSSAT